MQFNGFRKGRSLKSDCKETFREDGEENIKPWMAMGRKVTRRKQC